MSSPGNLLKNQNSVPVLDVDYGIRNKMTRAKTQSTPSSTPSISEIKNSKLEIRNSKQIQMIKKRKIPNNLVLDFDFEI